MRATGSADMRPAGRPALPASSLPTCKPNRQPLGPRPVRRPRAIAPHLDQDLPLLGAQALTDA